MKKLICLIIAFVLCLILAGCIGVSEGETIMSSKYCDMVVVEDTNDYRILQDADTGVLYLWYRENDIYGQTLTPLYNADGTLKNINDYK